MKQTEVHYRTHGIVDWASVYEATIARFKKLNTDDKVTCLMDVAMVTVIIWQFILSL